MMNFIWSFFCIYWDDHMVFIFQFVNALFWASQVVLVAKNLPATAGEARNMGLILGWRRSSGEGNGNLLQYSCWDNSMDRKLGRLQSVGSQRVWYNWSDWTYIHACIFRWIRRLSMTGIVTPSDSSLIF